MSEHDNNEAPSLKLRTARTLKWNTIDRVSSQILYAVVGVVLANLLSKVDFGLVGVLLIFQAFGILFVDSGFGTALLQKKEPTRTDYSTVYWFNTIVSLVIYALLFAGAPLIADIFQGDTRLIPLSRVMFISFIFNGQCLVQTTRLMKEMNVKQIAIANMIGLTASGAVGIYLATEGYGAWALVWQTVTLSFVKSVWLWITGRWSPEFIFSRESLKHIWRVGISVFSSSTLNTFFLYIYSFVIGAFYSLSSLGVYTQADKWSKMGSASISQILTASFVPLLAKFQDDGENFRRYVHKINRFAAFILFPIMIGIAVIGQPLFHTLFGTKWDAAIILFQILTIRGIFIVLTSLCNNYILALGHARRLFIIEIIKDVMIFAAILATIWFGSLQLLVWGQLAASFITYFIVLRITARATSIRARDMIADIAPFLGLSLLMTAICITITLIPDIAPGNIRISAAIQMVMMMIVGILTYCIGLKIIGNPELKEASDYAFGRLKRLRADRHA